MSKTLLLSSLLFAFATVTGCATTLSSKVDSNTADSNTADSNKVATAQPTPASVGELSWDQVDSALKSGAVLVDVRAASEYAQGHIEGAVNAPIAQTIEGLPSNKAVHVIFYADGPTSDASSRAARLAAKQGYAQVSDFTSGYAGWLMRM